MQVNGCLGRRYEMNGTGARLAPAVAPSIFGNKSYDFSEGDYSGQLRSALASIAPISFGTRFAMIPARIGNLSPSPGIPGEGRGEGSSLPLIYQAIKIPRVPVPRDNSRRLLRFARDLRKESTDAENKLWLILRSRRLAGFKFRRQHRIAGYIVDFYCVRYRLAIELDGGQHADPNALRYDERRTRDLNELGIRVLRFWDHDLLKDTALVADEIFRRLNESEV